MPISDPFIAKPCKAAPNLRKLTLQDAKAACEKVWLEFFSRLQSYAIAAEPIDLAIWEIHALSCRVMCRPGSSYRDENDPAREAPGMIFFLANAFEQEMRRILIATCDGELTQKEGDRQLAEIEKEFFDLISTAVLDAFESPVIQKRFTACPTAFKQFSIFVTPNDEGLDSSKLTLIWKNKLGLTAEQVREQAIQLSRGSANKRAVKKSPAKLLAEGRTKKEAKKLPAKKKTSSKKSSAGAVVKKSATRKAVKKIKKATNIKKKPKK